MNASDRASDAPGVVSEERRPPEQRRWTLHALNSGLIFKATRRGVSFLPPSISYGIGHVGTWLAWRLMDDTREALADNLRAVFPDASTRELHRHALATLRAYAIDVINFLRALPAHGEEARALFETSPASDQLFRDLLSENRGIILVTGHYGNWEMGGVFMRRVFPLPLSIVAMAEASEDANRIRREIRDSLGADTIEVRKSLDTALQIRRRLGENGVVAMLMARHVGRDRVPVTFLGRQASFLRTPALMGYLTGAPLVPCFIERVGRSRYRVEPGTPIRVSREVPREDSLRAAAQQVADQLGERIRRHPYHWYQFYPYWKSQVDQDDEPS